MDDSSAPPPCPDALTLESYLALRRRNALMIAQALNMEFFHEPWGFGAVERPARPRRGMMLLTQPPPPGAVDSYVRERGPNMIGLIGPALEWAPTAHEAGWRVSDHCQVMAHNDLSRLPTPTLPAPLRLLPVVSGAALGCGAGGSALSQVSSRDFHECLRVSDELTEETDDEFVTAFADLPALAALAACEPSGRVVATSAARVIDALAMVLMVSTRPEWRGAGVGTSMTGAALQDAHARGALQAVLDASPPGVSIYRRLGFDTLGSMVYLTSGPTATPFVPGPPPPPPVPASGS